ncbi:MAG: hypothetical protein ACLR7U_11015 [Ruthenibacterium lactatiformans]
MYYPIWREKMYTAEDEKTLPQDCYKPRYVIVDGIAHPYTKYSQLPDAFTLRYEAYPADIPDNAPDETEFDLPDEAVLAVILFVAAQTQSMEYDQRFFQSFYAQYQGKLSNLSGQADGPAAVVTGGAMFKQTNMPRASAPTLSQVKIDTFLGADLTNSPANADENRSPDCENMIRDVPGKVRKRMGWQVKRTLDGRINGYHALMGHDPLVHAGTKLYKGDSVVYSDANDARSRSWEFGEKLYIADGKALLCYDGTAVTRVDADAYIPTLTIARAPNGGGEEYENANLISPKYREQFLGYEAEDKTYQMSLVPLDSTPVEAELLQTDGSWKPMAENSGFTVNRTAGTVTFTTAPGVSPVAGQDNVKITASHTVEGYADRINKCRIGIQFGVNGATDRLFLSGSPQLINYDWYSGLNDPTYWRPGLVLGQSDSAIVGYSIVNARLAAHKDSTDSDRNVIVREGTLVDNKPAFPIVNILQGEGAIGPYSFGYLGTEPLFLTKLGVYAITAQDITGEKYSQSRSFFLNGKLLEENGLEEAFALVYKDMYWLCLNGRAYILDGLQATQTDRSAPYSTRQYAGFYCTNIPARVLWEQDGALWFGTADGRLCAFANEPSDR